MSIENIMGYDTYPPDAVKPKRRRKGFWKKFLLAIGDRWVKHADFFEENSYAKVASMANKRGFGIRRSTCGDLVQFHKKEG